MPEDLLANYEGFYRGVYAEGGFYSNAGPGYPSRIEIGVRDGKLWATQWHPDPERDEHLEPEEIIPLSETRFFWPAEGEFIEFERDDAGAVVRYRARYGLNEWVMRRMR